MTFTEAGALPTHGHELANIGGPQEAWWCLRCGALRLEENGGRWEAPGQAGRSITSIDAPPCLASTDAGATNPSADAHLMLRALTHGWRCDPIRLATWQDGEGWRWSRAGLLGGESWSVRGDWADGPAIDATLRKLLTTTTG
jgi:hypothetical protein